ncbi:MAG: hypothetical protein K1X88_09625 [Nannocystaceae bacterium]|nr:hypothetical protein [Nannocystaceae bacterium]
MFALGSPESCIDVFEKDIATPAKGSWEDPIIVRRDNLGVVGEFGITTAGVKADAQGEFLTGGSWSNLSGHVKIEEIREHYWPFVSHYTPVLPAADFTSPGAADYGVRAATMVHGNSYAMSVEAWTDDGEVFEPGPRYAKLADDVLVVPVVLGVWFDPYNPKIPVLEAVYGGRNLFDFSPLWVDDQAAPLPYFTSASEKVTPQHLASPNPLFASEIDEPDPYWVADMAPDRFETPPDEIWTACGIQFQVVAYYVAQYPDAWVNHCSTNSLNFGDPEWALEAELAADPLLPHIEELDPIYVSYGDLSECSSDLLGGFVGSTPGKGRFIEIDYNRPSATTAHELGHALGLDHVGSEVGKDNLMLEYVGGEHEVLTEKQCDQARAMAKQFSERYDTFNWQTGRTYSETVPEPPKGDDSGGDITLPEQTGTCCLVDGDAVVVDGSCDKELPEDACAMVCCENPNNKTTRYACEQLGAPEVECAGPK